jgi:tetratricopeptide (TPR) repeat protein
MKKDYFNAAYEYSMIIEFEPENNDAIMFFKNNDEKIKEIVIQIKIEIKKSLNENNLVLAENKLNKLKIIIPRDAELKYLVVEVKKKKQISEQTIAYVKNTKIKEDPEMYYKNALKAFNEKDYLIAKKEIRRYRNIKEDQKSLDLYNKIDGEIKKIVNELMPDAILNYNSQKYDEALKLFNQVLEVDNNDEALDYKVRIERKLKALDVL